VDTGGYRCTSLISHVLDYHMTDMLNDGFLDRAWRDHLERTASIQCIKENGNTGGGLEDATSSLTVQDVGGIFIVHAVLSVVAVAMATYQFIRKARRGNMQDTDATLSDVYGITQVRAKSQKLLKMLSVSQTSAGNEATESERQQQAENNDAGSKNYKTEDSDTDNDLLLTFHSNIPEEDPLRLNDPSDEQA
jgi:hypothetical protein